MGFHKNQTPTTGIHVIHAFEYSNASARTGATGLVSTDINKVAKQLDDSSFWVLTNNSPVTWVRLDAGAAITDHGSLTGLGDDDHSQYILVDGTRAFTAAIGGVTPSTTAHLATKGYVDTEIGASWIEDEYVPTNGQVSFVLSATPRDVDSFALIVNGITADDTTEYTLSGVNLTWLNALYSLDSNDKVLARYV